MTMALAADKNGVVVETRQESIAIVIKI